VPENSKSWRIFIAVELPADVRHKLTRHIDRLRNELPDVRASWIREQNLHLTIKFFGDILVERVEAASATLKAAANKIQSFEIQIDGCGAFPPQVRPKVLWMGINDPFGSLQRLHGALEDECAKAGFERDQRPFHPHLTIARIRNPQNAHQLAALHEETAFDSLLVKVSDVCLIRSELNSEGSRYTIVARHQLEG
jgi:2'-5' RNA ligase